MPAKREHGPLDPDKNLGIIESSALERCALGGALVHNPEFRRTFDDLFAEESVGDLGVQPMSKELGNFWADLASRELEKIEKKEAPKTCAHSLEDHAAALRELIKRLPDLSN